MRCDIIIPVFNEPDITRECVDSIMRKTECPFGLIMIDNGSSDETRRYLEGLKKNSPVGYKLIRNETNLGFAKAVNQGIGASDAPFICVMNNDTIVTAGWLKEMLDVLESHPEIGIVNPSSNTSGQYPAKGESIDNYAKKAFERLAGEIQELYNARGFCMLMRREVIRRAGLLDEVFGLGYFEETDYSRRAHQNNFQIARAKACYVYHKEAVTFKGLKDAEGLFRRNQEIFFKRWGRPVRVGYLVDRTDKGGKVDGMAKAAARSGNQMVIFLKKGLDWPVTIDHFDIRRVDVNPFFFGIVSICRIMKRRKKKPIEVILTDNGVIGAFLNAVKGLHGARVMVSQDEEALIAAIKKRSRESQELSTA